MANGTRTGKQTAILVFSILALIAGVFAILGGIAAIGGGALIAAESGDVSTTVDGVTLTGTDMAGFAGIAGIITVVSGIMALLEGIFGIRAANDAAKAQPFIVMAIITLVVAVLSFLASSGVEPAQLCGLVIDAVCVWLGISVKKEGTAL